MTTAAAAAKVRLRQAWFAEHSKQQIPEARAEVERLFAAIEAEARQQGRSAAKAEAEGRIRKILKGTRWLTQLRRTLGIER